MPTASARTTSRARIAAADKATTEIVQHWIEAESVLNDGVDYNGAGVLYDPSSTLYKLLDAQKAIEKALAVHRATTWPTNADYDE